ncbi:DUF3137 domain-containing protein [[Mycoplasma] falconis]|uniref:DUF3137 domain-containing protein n=1 Tax=[Mycoplasma] falconis TaxID=92403 RepID=A0A501XAP9_9BACT|nr:DUF3137 domain-containing protein [[Mycoplasma] falconis]TPE57546.1 DUF3137 domain-containing protein [[Mycoplasma] falconis]
MKTAENLVSFEEFKNKTDREILTNIKESVDDCFKKPELKQYKKARKLTNIFLGLSLGILFIGFFSFLVFMFLYTSEINNQIRNALFGILIVLGLALTTFFILYLVYKKIRNEKQIIVKSFLLDSLQSKKIYEKATKLLDKRWELITNKYIPVNERLSYNANTRRFSKTEYINNRPDFIPSSAYILNTTPCQTVMVDGKYPVHFSNILWEDIVKHVDTKGNVSYQKRHYNSTLMKVNASGLDIDKRASFSYFSQEFLGHKKVQLENKIFNKLFKVYSNDELKMYMYFTPFVQENLIRLYKEFMRYTHINHLRFYANNDVIIYSFMSPPEYMNIDIPNKFKNETTVTNFIYNDVLKDFYSFYWLLALVYIPVYLY